MRSFVIAIKYAYFSDIHMDMIESVDLGEELNAFDQVLNVIYIDDPNVLL